MAAEEALKKLEEQLNCSICLDTYTDPKLLPCHHVYCKKCLVKLVIRDKQGDLVLTCPQCRQVTPVPPKGVAGFQSAFHINPLLEIQDSLQNLRVDTEFVEGAVGSDSSSLNAVSKAGYCSEHSEKELELYCETCGKLICCYCAIKGGKHHSHDHELLSKAYEKYTKDIAVSVEPMEKHLQVIDRVLAQVQNSCEAVPGKQAEIEEEIRNTMRQLHEILYARETSLIDELHQITQSKLKELAAKKDQLETTQVQLRSCLEFMKESLKTEKQGEVLRMKTTIVKQVKELTTMLPPDALKSPTEMDTAFIAMKNFEEECQKYGQLATGSFELGVIKMPCQIIEGFKAPWGVVVNHQGQIIVTDAARHCVYKFSSAGVKLRAFGGPGSEPRRFLTPYGVAVDTDGNILVVDSYNHRLQKFTSVGDFLTIVGSAGTGPLQFKEPKDIVFNPKNGKLYVVEDNCRVQVLNSDMTFSFAFGSEGSGEGQFRYPCGITCDGNGDVYVVDSNNNRIQVFTPEGEFVRQFGSFGKRKGELDLPIGIAVHKGLVYVSEYNNHRISVFTTDGKFVLCFGREGRDIGKFCFPGSLTVHNECLYVCGRFNPHVQVFAI